jgi:ribonuclease P/MRP protein subunit RPP25
MEKEYKKVGERKTEENEIRVTSKGQLRGYVRYAINILTKEDSTHEEIVVKATGNAIVKGLILVEIIKRRVGGLYQNNNIYSINLASDSRKKDDGETPSAEDPGRRVSILEVHLAKIQLDTNLVGYQKPIAKEEFTPSDKRGRGGRGGRGGRDDRGGERGGERGGRGRGGRGDMRGWRGDTRGGRG